MSRLLIVLLLVGCGPRGAAPPATVPSTEVTPAPVGAPADAPATPEATPADAPTPPGDEATPPGDAPTDGTDAPTDGTDAPTDGTDVPTVGGLPGPAALYAECEQRLEQPESEGECSKDSDCAPAGCSQEICTTPEAAAGMMSTCEMLPCFEVVESCGCQSGRCRWSIKGALQLKKLKLPAQ